MAEDDGKHSVYSQRRNIWRYSEKDDSVDPTDETLEQKEEETLHELSPSLKYATYPLNLEKALFFEPFLYFRGIAFDPFGFYLDFFNRLIDIPLYGAEAFSPLCKSAL